MKKKFLGTLVFLTAVTWLLIFSGCSSGEATEVDNKAGEEIAKELEDSYDDMDLTGFEEDTAANDEEEFDPEAML